MATVECSETRATQLRDYIYGTQCCGLAEFSGLHMVRNPEDAKAIRRAAFLARNAGQVFITFTNEQSSPSYPALYERLKAGGFRKHSTFRNPNTGNTVTLMSATTLKRKQK